MIPFDCVKQVAALTQYAATIVVGPDTEAEASARRKEFRNLFNELERHRKAEKEPLLAQTRTVDSTFAVLTKPLMDAQAVLDRKLADRLAAVAAERRAAEQAAMAPAGPDAFGIPADLSSVASVASSPTAIIKTKIVQRMVVTNPALIPDRFWMLDMVALRQAVIVDGLPVLGVSVVDEEVPA